MIAGYKIVDFKNIDITSNAETQTDVGVDVYKGLCANMPIIVVNLSIDTIPLKPFYANVQDETNMVFRFFKGYSTVVYEVSVSEDGLATVTTTTLATPET